MYFRKVLMGRVTLVEGLAESHSVICIALCHKKKFPWGPNYFFFVKLISQQNKEMVFLWLELYFVLGKDSRIPWQAPSAVLKSPPNHSPITVSLISSQVLGQRHSRQTVNSRTQPSLHRRLKILNLKICCWRRHGMVPNFLVLPHLMFVPRKMSRKRPSLLWTTVLELLIELP